MDRFCQPRKLYIISQGLIEYNETYRKAEAIQLAMHSRQSFQTRTDHASLVRKGSRGSVRQPQETEDPEGRHSSHTPLRHSMPCRCKVAEGRCEGALPKTCSKPEVLCGWKMMVHDQRLSSHHPCGPRHARANGMGSVLMQLNMLGHASALVHGKASNERAC
jgi:hypothetical protein